MLKTKQKNRGAKLEEVTLAKSEESELQTK